MILTFRSKRNTQGSKFRSSNLRSCSIALLLARAIKRAIYFIIINIVNGVHDNIDCSIETSFKSFPRVIDRKVWKFEKNYRWNFDSSLSLLLDRFWHALAEQNRERESAFDRYHLLPVNLWIVFVTICLAGERHGWQLRCRDISSTDIMQFIIALILPFRARVRAKQ